MRTDWRQALWWVTGVTALFIALMVALLIYLGKDREDPLSITEVAGVWHGSDGGRLTVRADGTADLEHRSYTGPATWVFDTYPDERPGIRFGYQGPATAKPGKLYLVIFPGKNGANGFIPQDPPGVRYTRSAGQQGDTVSRTDPAGG